MPRSVALELMSEQEQRAERLLADARIWDATHLHRLAEEHGNSISRATVRRYLYDPPERLDLRVLRILADELGFRGSLDDFLRSLYGPMGRYLGSVRFWPALVGQ